MSLLQQITDISLTNDWNTLDLITSVTLSLSLFLSRDLKRFCKESGAVLQGAA